MDNISAHISWEEATHSDTATRLKISNIPNNEQLAHMKLVANCLFEPVRVAWGKPIRINSFFRSVALNKAIGGVATSQHCTGNAIDIDTGSREENLKLFNLIRKDFAFDQLIWEFGDKTGPDWIHISYCPAVHNRGNVLRAIKHVNGKTSYHPF
jgi:zinc D-Ala-D-Ala carboxypeptidase